MYLKPVSVLLIVLLSFVASAPSFSRRHWSPMSRNLVGPVTRQNHGLDQPHTDRSQKLPGPHDNPKISSWPGSLTCLYTYGWCLFRLWVDRDCDERINRCRPRCVDTFELHLNATYDHFCYSNGTVSAAQPAEKRSVVEDNDTTSLDGTYGTAVTVHEPEDVYVNRRQNNLNVYGNMEVDVWPGLWWCLQTYSWCLLRLWGDGMCDVKLERCRPSFMNTTQLHLNVTHRRPWHSNGNVRPDQLWVKRFNLGTTEDDNRMLLDENDRPPSHESKDASSFPSSPHDGYPSEMPGFFWKCPWIFVNCIWRFWTFGCQRDLLKCNPHTGANYTADPRYFINRHNGEVGVPDDQQLVETHNNPLYSRSHQNSAVNDGQPIMRRSYPILLEKDGSRLFDGNSSLALTHSGFREDNLVSAHNMKARKAQVPSSWKCYLLYGKCIWRHWPGYCQNEVEKCKANQMNPKEDQTQTHNATAGRRDEPHKRLSNSGSALKRFDSVALGDDNQTSLNGNRSIPIVPQREAKDFVFISRRGGKPPFFGPASLTCWWRFFWCMVRPWELHCVDRFTTCNEHHSWNATKNRPEIQNITISPVADHQHQRRGDKPHPKQYPADKLNWTYIDSVIPDSHTWIHKGWNGATHWACTWRGMACSTFFTRLDFCRKWRKKCKWIWQQGQVGDLWSVNTTPLET